MLLDGEPGPGGLSAASPQSQAGEWGQDLRLEGWGREGVERARRARRSPLLQRQQSTKGGRLKPGSPELSPKFTTGPDLCSLEHLPGSPWSPTCSRAQPVTGSQEASAVAGGAGGWGGEHHAIPQPGGDSQQPRAPSTRPGLGPLSPCPLALTLLFGSLLPSTPLSILPSSMPSFHASLSSSLPPSFSLPYHSCPVMKSHREKLHSPKAGVNLL